jgi:hypothetical protein
MTAKIKKKGIYCIEGLWDHGNIQDETTVLPILDLLEKWKHKAINEKIPNSIFSIPWRPWLYFPNA